MDSGPIGMATIQDLARCITNLDSRMERFNEGQTLMTGLLLKMNPDHGQASVAKRILDLDRIDDLPEMPKASPQFAFDRQGHVGRQDEVSEDLAAFRESLIADLQRQHTSLIADLQHSSYEILEHLGSMKQEAQKQRPSHTSSHTTDSRDDMPCEADVSERGRHSSFSLTPTSESAGKLRPPLLLNQVSSGNGAATLDELATEAIELEDKVEYGSGGSHEGNPEFDLKDINNSMGGLFGGESDDIEAHQYFVEDLYYASGCCQAAARSHWFQNLSVFVVVLNAAYMGVDSGFNESGNLYDADLFFLVSSFFFAIFFTAELLVRLLAFEKKRDCLRDGWFKFDLFLVVTMILDQWCLEVYAKLSEGTGVNIPVQPIRLLRLLKLSRMARLMQAFPELITMIKGIIRALRAVSSSMILIGLMVYCWGITLHMLLKDEDELNAHIRKEVLYWGHDLSTLTDCMWTLFVNGTLLLDQTAPLMAALVYSDKVNVFVAGCCFMVFTCFTALLILQMLIGVLCDVVQQVSQEKKDTRAIGLIKQQLLTKLQEFGNGKGSITQEGVLQVMAHPQAKAVLTELNINHLFLLQMQRLVFSKAGATVKIKTLLDLMIMCRGDRFSSVQTLAGGFCFIEHQLDSFYDQVMQKLEKLQVRPD